MTTTKLYVKYVYYHIINRKITLSGTNSLLHYRATIITLSDSKFIALLGQNYYIIRQQVYYIIGRCYYIIRQLLHYQAFFLHHQTVITLIVDYYIIGCTTCPQRGRTSPLIYQQCYEYNNACITRHAFV